MVSVNFNRESEFDWLPNVHLTELFLYSFEADFIQGLLTKTTTKPSRSFHFTDNIQIIIFPHIYLMDLEITDSTDTVGSASYIHLYLSLSK